MLTSATMVVAFWLNFGSGLFRRTPAPSMLLWLGAGTTAIAGVLGLLALRSRLAGASSVSAHHNG